MNVTFRWKKLQDGGQRCTGVFKTRIGTLTIEKDLEVLIDVTPEVIEAVELGCMREIGSLLADVEVGQ